MTDQDDPRMRARSALQENADDSAEPADAPQGGPGVSGPADAGRLLLEFVQERDVQCPRCGYNLRNLTRAVCPECREPLVLTVGVKKLRLGRFLVAITPGIFSGMCGILLLMIGVIVPGQVGAPPPPWPYWLLDGFGLASGAIAGLIILRREAFLRLENDYQHGIAATIWTVHIAAFIVVMYSVIF